MKHVATQITTKAPAKNHSTYAAFRVDPTFNFDNFNVEHNVRQTPSSNFSRPLSIRPTYSSDDPDPKAIFILPELSRQSSFTSSWRDSGHSTAPSTPVPETPSAQFLGAPIIFSSDDSAHIDTVRSSSAIEPSKFADRMSFMMSGSSKVSDLDLSFPAERLFLNNADRPQSALLYSSNNRPGTASGPKDAQKDAPKEVPKATATALVLTPLQPPEDIRFEEPRSAPPTTTSFSEFKQALVERQASQKAASLKSGPPSPALPFLQQDPFKCPIHGEKRQRPKSAGVGASPLSQETDATGGIGLDAPVKKQRAPSIMSTKSTKSMRSIKRSLWRFKKLLKGPLNEDD